MASSLSHTARITVAVLLAAIAAAIVGIAVRGASDADAALAKSEKGYLKLVDQQTTRGAGDTNVMVSGGSKDRQHRDWIEIKNYKTGFTALGGGSACRPLVVKTEPNPSWPVLAEMAAEPNSDIDFGTLDITRDGGKAGPASFRKYDFGDANVEDVDEEDDIQTITISYGSMTYTYRPLRADGTPGSPIVTNISCG